MKLKEWFERMKESELIMIDEGNVDDDRIDEYRELCNEFWKFEGEDRDIVLEDLKKDEGLLYVKMVEWNENELIIELDLNMVWYEYSLEDYFRDYFEDEFSIEDINRMMYGNEE